MEQQRNWTWIQFQQVGGDPTRKFSGGKWTVNFDGTDMLGTDSSYNGKNYTAFAVSRQTGGDINANCESSKLVFGYHNGGNNRFHFNGWLYSGRMPRIQTGTCTLRP